MKKLLIIPFLLWATSVWANPSNSLTLTNAVPRTVISSVDYNNNNNTTVSTYNSHTHTDIAQLGTVNVGVWNGTPITDAYLGSITTAGKLNGTAITNLNGIPVAAGTIPAANLTSVMPSGMILMWHGSIATIPTGFVLCDGTNGTPDLRDRFIVAATQDDSGVAKSNITGSLLQSHDTGIIPAHTHTYSQNGGSSCSTGGSNSPASSFSSQATGSYGTGTKNIAVFFALAYVMKT